MNISISISGYFKENSDILTRPGLKVFDDEGTFFHNLRQNKNDWANQFHPSLFCCMISP